MASSPLSPQQLLLLAIVEIDVDEDVFVHDHNKTNEDEVASVIRLKLRVYQNEESAQSLSRYDLLEELKRQVFETQLSAETPLAFDEYRVLIFDQCQRQYIPLVTSDKDGVLTHGTETEDVLGRFGSRVRIRIEKRGTSKRKRNQEETKECSDAEVSREPVVGLLKGRCFDWDRNPADGSLRIANRVLHIQEPYAASETDHPSADIGTAGSLWDGSLYLARTLEAHHRPSFNSSLVADCDKAVRLSVNGKSVLELGSGSTGLCGMVASILGARQVLCTDLAEVVPYLRKNLERNREALGIGPDSTETAGEDCAVRRLDCCALDWTEQALPQQVLDLDPDVVLVADCVWLESLVEPLLRTMERINAHRKLSCNDSPVEFYIAYQRRGKAAHCKFWKELKQLFSNIQEVPMSHSSIDSDTLWYKPDSLSLLHCHV